MVAMALMLRSFHVHVTEADAAKVVPEETIAFAPMKLFVTITPR
jgi:hypothetical protein